MPDQPWPTTRRTLLVRIQDEHDTEAWQEFLDVYRPLIYRFCRRRGLQHADAEDVTQDVVSRLPQFRYDPAQGRFRGWLGTVLRRAIQRYVERAGRAVRGKGGSDRVVIATDYDHDGLDWDRLYHDHILHTALDRVCPEFDDETWAVFVRTSLDIRQTDLGETTVWLADRSRNGEAAEVAAHFGRDVGWVYKARFRVTKRLKEEVLRLSDLC